MTSGCLTICENYHHLSGRGMYLRQRYLLVVNVWRPKRMRLVSNAIIIIFHRGWPGGGYRARRLSSGALYQ